MGARRLSGAAICAGLALALAPGALAAEPGAYRGKLLSVDADRAVPSSKVTFKVSGSTLRKFRVGGGISTCVSLNVITGDLDFTYYPLSFWVPSAPIRGSKVARDFIARDDDGRKIATNSISGRFSGRSAAGRLKQKGPSSCAASYRWRAKRTR
jgi:hypothetical protein